MRYTIFLDIIEVENKNFILEIFKNQNHNFFLNISEVENSYNKEINQLTFIHENTLEKKTLYFKNELTYNLKELKEGNYKIKINDKDRFKLYISN